MLLFGQRSVRHLKCFGRMLARALFFLRGCARPDTLRYVTFGKHARCYDRRGEWAMELRA
jgi:hypothetical protein